MKRTTSDLPPRTGPRLAPIDPQQMSPAQRRIADAITAGPRKGLGGPFNAWLRSPELADRLQKVGEYVRFNSTLPPRLSEFAILITARQWMAQYEWYAHCPLAIKAGVDVQITSDLAAGKRPTGLQPDERIVYDFVTQLARRKRVGDKTYAAAIAAFGEQGVIDLIGIHGYYTVVAMTLNVAEVPIPDGLEPPLKPLRK
jgi:4-carboxymuconolactone decarboxylase